MFCVCVYMDVCLSTRSHCLFLHRLTDYHTHILLYLVYTVKQSLAPDHTGAQFRRCRLR
ncbi:hypothetical protein BX600DRAFT_455008 [Xylariales sp. PMI_506]|nr:hypothetical protein BX600DRAFT_455008 [Xylariales sp. PMI_506]